MNIDSDLTFSVAVPGRSPASGQVTAVGSHVTIDTSDPVAVWDGALGTTTAGAPVMRFVAGQLADQGLTVTLTGPGGRVASIGAGVDSVLGRVTTGSRQVSLGRPGAVAPIARARLLVELRRHRSLVIAAAVAAASVAVASVVAEGR